MRLNCFIEQELAGYGFTDVAITRYFLFSKIVAFGTILEGLASMIRTPHQSTRSHMDKSNLLSDRP